MSSSEGTSDFIRVVVAYFLPPVGVFMQTGVGAPLFINIVLTCLLWIPGTLHAIWVITNVGPEGKPNPDGGKDFVALVLGALFPPAGVFIKTGVGLPLIINVVLLWFMWIPAILHAAWVITQPSEVK